MTSNRVPAVLRNASMGRDKEQSIGTPDWYLEQGVYPVFGRPIHRDPCDDGRRRICALHYNTVENSGLDVSWALETVFFNPPFEDLGLWLAKAFLEFTFNKAQCIGIFPVRSHRTYWPFAWTARRLCFFPPFPWEGSKWSFPLPVVAAYWGNDPELFDFWHTRIRVPGSNMKTHVIDPLTIKMNGPIVLPMDTPTPPARNQNPPDTVLDERASKVKAQYTQFMKNDRRNAVLRAVQQMQNVTIRDLDILPEDDLELLLDLPICLLVPPPVTDEDEDEDEDGDEDETETPTRRPKAKRKPPTNRPKAKNKPKTRTRATAADVEKRNDDVKRALKRAKGDGLNMGELQEEFPDCSAAQIRQSLLALAEEGHLAEEGTTRSKRYYFAP